jgi:hypothetical protein
MRSVYSVSTHSVTTRFLYSSSTQSQQEFYIYVYCINSQSQNYINKSARRSGYYIKGRPIKYYIILISNDQK